MSLVNWVIGGLLIGVVISMLIGIFGVFFYDQAASAAKSVVSTVKSGRKK